ncbi:hypothetical protein AB0E25_38190 [Streptomyces bobili]|uniref:hypothetical protein n=1 Tax=Streptomyces bobili TaxID=67280 RepID=UPI0033DFFF2C
MQLPDDTALDGELVVWEADRLAFERLQQRLPRHGIAAATAAAQWPAHFVAFDVLRLAGTDTTAFSQGVSGPGGRPPVAMPCCRDLPFISTADAEWAVRELMSVPDLATA